MTPHGGAARDGEHCASGDFTQAPCDAVTRSVGWKIWRATALPVTQSRSGSACAG